MSYVCNGKETLYRCFPVNFSKFLRKTFFTEHLRWLLLKSHTSSTSIFATLIFHQKEIFPLSTSAGNIVKRLRERIIRRVAKRGEGGRGLLCLFLKIGKKCPNFWEKCPDCGHLCVKSLI